MHSFLKVCCHPNTSKHKQTPTGLRYSATEGYYNPDVFKVQHSVKIFHTISCSLK